MNALNHLQISLIRPIHQRMSVNLLSNYSHYSRCSSSSINNTQKGFFVKTSASQLYDIRRCFATKRTNKKKKSKANHHPQNRKQKKHEHHPPHRRRPPKIKQDKTPKQAPPLFLYPTASPTVYISCVAIDTLNEDVESPEQEFHPTSFFTEMNPPQSFITSSFEYVSPKQFDHELPTNKDIPEVAFLGRSNVGKSSLLNAITGNPHLARISKTPGRTQQVNYFGQFTKAQKKGDGGLNTTVTAKYEERDINSTPPYGYIIDLPGYGTCRVIG